MKINSVIVALLVVHVGCKQAVPTPYGGAEGDACAKPDDCGPGLTCSIMYICVTPATMACIAKRPCRDDGHCTAKDGECIASANADCENSGLCRDDGLCAAKDGKCVPGGAINNDSLKNARIERAGTLVDNVSKIVSSYAVTHRSLPRDLNELVERQYIKKNQTKDPWKNDLEFSAGNSGQIDDFTLCSYGPNGSSDGGSGDDICSSHRR